MIKRECVDEERWVGEETFQEDARVYQVLPGPEAHELCVYFGRIRGGKVGGLLAGSASCSPVLPAFVLPIFLHRRLVALAENRLFRPFLLGVAAGVIGLIAAVGIDIIDAGIVDVPTAMMAVGAFLALNRWRGKPTVLWVVLGCGGIGAVIQATATV